MIGHPLRFPTVVLLASASSAGACPCRTRVLLHRSLLHPPLVLPNSIVKHARFSDHAATANMAGHAAKSGLELLSFIDASPSRELPAAEQISRSLLISPSFSRCQWRQDASGEGGFCRNQSACATTPTARSILIQSNRSEILGQRSANRAANIS